MIIFSVSLQRKNARASSFYGCFDNIVTEDFQTFMLSSTTAFYVMEEKMSKLNSLVIFYHSCVGAILPDFLLTRTK